MSTSAQSRSQHRDPAPDDITTPRSSGQGRSGAVSEPDLLRMDGLVTSSGRTLSGWRRVLARLAGVRPVHVVDLTPADGPRAGVAVVDLREGSSHPSSTVPAQHEVPDDPDLKQRRRAADVRTVSQDDTERQPSVDREFSVSLTDKDLVRRRDEIIARTRAEIDELESRSARS